jgi:hypothetical protein
VVIISRLAALSANSYNDQQPASEHKHAVDSPSPFACINPPPWHAQHDSQSRAPVISQNPDAHESNSACTFSCYWSTSVHLRARAAGPAAAVTAVPRQMLNWTQRQMCSAQAEVPNCHSQQTAAEKLQQAATRALSAEFCLSCIARYTSTTTLRLAKHQHVHCPNFDRSRPGVNAQPHTCACRTYEPGHAHKQKQKETDREAQGSHFAATASCETR